MGPWHASPSKQPVMCDLCLLGSGFGRGMGFEQRLCICRYSCLDIVAQVPQLCILWVRSAGPRGVQGSAAVQLHRPKCCCRYAHTYVMLHNLCVCAVHCKQVCMDCICGYAGTCCSQSLACLWFSWMPDECTAAVSLPL